MLVKEIWGCTLRNYCLFAWFLLYLEKQDFEHSLKVNKIVKILDTITFYFQLIICTRPQTLANCSGQKEAMTRINVTPWNSLSRAGNSLRERRDFKSAGLQSTTIG